MAATMYSAALMPFSQTQSYPMPLILCTNFFTLLTTMPMPYCGELICPSTPSLSDQITEFKNIRITCTEFQYVAI